MPELKKTIDNVGGFTVAGIHAGLKADGERDMALIVADTDCISACVFTKNRVKAAPVLVNMQHLEVSAEKMRAVVVNTKSANAATGEQGMHDAQKMASLVADKMGCDVQQVFVMSTGVIGALLPMPKIEVGINKAHAELAHDWESAADAIRTTDIYPKLASITVMTEQGDYTVAGITKGAGMIAPNMATMLGVLVTDAKFTSAEQAQRLLTQTANLSYNRIVVDGDTSTNDMVTLMGSGTSGVEITTEADEAQFSEALTQVATYLAQQVVRDGEGASKFITINVQGAESTVDAEKIAHTIAASPLVKTAFYGNDANWGRMVAAAGRAGIPFDATKLSLWMQVSEQSTENNRGLLLFEAGTKADYDEAEATAIIKHTDITVTLDLNVGDGQAIVWTCDLTHEYVSINADYRT
ncbi:MAG: bifunctional glutamate N-acetyltransferase/amino-acid acetyltransferase ArgJ [Chloroflexota bacterium]